MPSARSTVAVLGALLFAGCSSSSHAPEPLPGSQPPTSGFITGPEGWIETFPVDRARLSPTGESKYFSLRPGRVHHYAGEEEVLTISVLDQTRVVDGVTTRVIEEREEADGDLSEISRNFVAIDPRTGDLYYFGEEVDIYREGRIIEHRGAWLAGQGGARFGLLLPGAPIQGMKYFQELAPGSAMDRATVVSLDERVETPAGTFDHCIHVVESSPLEPGESHKWFAPGVGLVKDDGVELTGHN